jgi:hypothetical protein
MFSEFYLTYTQLTKEQINKEFTKACATGDVKAIKYLLTSSEIEHRADIGTDNHAGIIAACMNERLDAVKFLLTSPELAEHSYIHAKDDAAFRCACIYKFYDVLDYLVNDYGIEQTNDINEHLINNPDKIVQAMFLNRNLELKLSKSVEKKHKLLKI